MLQIRIVDELPYSNDRHFIHLETPDEIALRFLDRISMDVEDAFRDPLSLQIMEELDHSHPGEGYTLITKMGTCCITSIASGFKLALLIAYYRNSQRARIVTDIFRTSINVWKWIGEHIDAEIYLLKEDFLIRGGASYCLYELDNCPFVKVSCDDEIITDFHKWESDVLRFSKEREAEIYRKHFPEHKDLFPPEKKADMSVQEFLEYLSNEIDEPDYYSDLLEYRVTVSESVHTIRNDYIMKYPTVYAVRRLGETYTLAQIHVVKYPNLLEALADIACESAKAEWEEQLVVFMDRSEKDIWQDYIDCITWGMRMDRAAKRMTFLDRDTATAQFHEAFQKAENIE